MIRIWESKDQRDSFFADLRELIGKYPNLGTYIFRKYQENPEEFGEQEDGYPYFDPDSPMFLNSLVLLITHTNVHNWEDLLVLDPMEQSLYTTIGLVDASSALLHENEE